MKNKIRKIVSILVILLFTSKVNAQNFIEIGDTTIIVNTVANVLCYANGETQEYNENQRVTIKYYAATDSLSSWCTVKNDVDDSKLETTEDGIKIRRPMLSVHDVQLYKIINDNSTCFYLYRGNNFITGVCKTQINGEQKWLFVTSATK